MAIKLSRLEYLLDEGGRQLLNIKEVAISYIITIKLQNPFKNLSPNHPQPQTLKQITNGFYLLIL